MSNKLMQVLNAQVGDVNARKNMATVTASIAVAYSLKMVSDNSDIPNPYSYFDQALEADAKTLLMEINESVIISVKDAIELARKLWVQRFNLIYSPVAMNPCALVAMVAEHNEDSVGTEFREYSKMYKISNATVMNELLTFVSDISVKYNALKQANSVE